MYIGTPDSTGMLTCIREILNNSVDEHLAGHCTHISVIRDTQNMFTITDNGRGVPFDKHESGKNALEVILVNYMQGEILQRRLYTLQVLMV